MRLNPHLHVVALDGVYVAGPDGQPVFRPLGRLKTDEVADVVQVTKARVLKTLERRSVVRGGPVRTTTSEAGRPDVTKGSLACANLSASPDAPASWPQRRRPFATADSTASHAVVLCVAVQIDYGPLPSESSLQCVPRCEVHWRFGSWLSPLAR